MPEPYQVDRNRDRERELDLHWMGEALRLAQLSVGLASPNPRVGCVLVRGGAIIGRGAHRYDERDHAEIVALREAETLARGATAYVTLEPCAHTGRTPPCAEALLKAGIARVVAATRDPNALVAGRGFAMLRDAGIAVSVGPLEAPCRAINDGFARWITTRLPFVTLKVALSLDGRIAPSPALQRPGNVTYLTGARSLLAVQKMRHAADAVMTGIGTVLADNPLLTDRSGGPRRRALLRVVLDSGLRLPLASRLVQTVQNDLLVFTADAADDENREAHGERRRMLEAAGAQVLTVPRTASGSLDIHAVLRELADRYGVLNVLTEGGSQLNRALLDSSAGAPAADKLCLFYAPMFLGDAGIPLLSGTLSEAVELRRSVLSESGSDFRLEAYLRDPWHES